MVWRAEDPQGHEAAKVKYDVVQYTRGAVLDLGCGPSKAFPHFVGVDSMKDTELFGIAMKPDIVVEDATMLDKFEDAACDAVFSSHMLEHLDDPWTALVEWWRVIKVGGHLCLYLPHRDLYPNIGTPYANLDHKFDFVPEDILAIMGGVALQSGTGFDVVVNEVRDAGMEYSFLLVLQKLERTDGVHRRTCFRERPEKTVCVVRYGGFGDMLQAANVLPAFKREGFHVTMMTTPKGQDILQHDPHIDDWFIQDDDQVPNHELAAFWVAQAKRFDRFVNLSESIEGTLLALPGRANHMWPTNLRREVMGKNYLEWTAKIAEVPYSNDAHFYPSESELAQTQRYLAHVKDRVSALKRRNAAQQIMGLMPSGLAAAPIITPVFNIMWCLSGSSVHKAYPHMDAVIAAILTEMPEAAIHLTGDVACQILESGWEKEPRVFRQCGEMNIRQTLTLAVNCDLVIGPETGVLNAVAFEKNFKVLMLSHSSFENLTKHWVNTATLEPNTEYAPCFPCHRLHYGRDFCPYEEETHAAKCAFSITPATVMEAVRTGYRRWKEL